MNSPAFTPDDWYWRAEDGRLFGSARAGMVPAGDPAFAAWADAGRTPTIWPGDKAGAQTDASLAVVLSAFGFHPAPAGSSAVDLLAYAAERRYAVETGGLTLNGVRIATDRASQAMIANAYAGMLAAGEERVRFKAASGWVELTLDQMKAVALAVFRHVQAAFAAEDAADVGINSAPPAIVDRSEVDAIFAPLVD